MEIRNTLFERLGGMSTVNISVDLFYKKVLADDKINGFFKDVDMVNQAGKMKGFLAYAFGAPVTAYTGKIMRYTHSKMAINEEHFNIVLEHLKETLQELEVEKNLIDEVIAISLSTKDDVLNI